MGRQEKRDRFSLGPLFAKESEKPIGNKGKRGSEKTDSFLYSIFGLPSLRTKVCSVLNLHDQSFAPREDDIPVRLFFFLPSSKISPLTYTHETYSQTTHALANPIKACFDELNQRKYGNRKK